MTLIKICYYDPDEIIGSHVSLSEGTNAYWTVSSHDLDSEDEHLPELEMIRTQTFEQALEARLTLATI